MSAGGLRKWRPPLWLVLGGALAATLAFALAGLVALRYLGPEIGFRQAALLLAALIGLLTLALAWLLARLLLRPIQALARYAAETRQGTAEVPAHFGTREIYAMAQGVIVMAQALQSREATIRSFTDHVTHELKTPVTALIAAAELLEDGDLAPGDRALVAQIGSAARQMQAQLANLRAMAAAREPGHHGACRLADLALHIEGLRLEAREGALLAVDDGPGISPGNRPHVFDPFFTTRRESGGTGMGLAIVASLLAAHGGSIALVSPPEGWRGAAFLIRFD